MYKEAIRPVLDYLDSKDILPSEEAHTLVNKFFHVSETSPLTLALFEKVFAYQGKRFTDPRLKVNVGGLELDNPVMVGAGWDKTGQNVKALWYLGAAAITVGTVPEFSQFGNPKKRQFMLAPGVVLNRDGFNSPGMHVVGKNLEKYQNCKIPIGVSLGINKDVAPTDAPEAYARVLRYLYNNASYFEVNVSSPNTPGLRKLQDKEYLKDIIQAANQTMMDAGGKKPLFVKIAPDLTFGAIDDVIQAVVDNHLAGIVATNTTDNPDIKAKYGEKWRNEAGGLSGDDEDFQSLSNKIIAYIFRQAGESLDIIGVAGVNDIWSAMGKIMCGAKAIQIVTGLREKGTTLPGEITQGLAHWIDIRKSAKNIQDFVGNSAFYLSTHTKLSAPQVDNADT